MTGPARDFSWAGPGCYGTRFQLGRAGPLRPEIWLGRAEDLQPCTGGQPLAIENLPIKFLSTVRRRLFCNLGNRRLYKIIHPGC